MLWPPPLSHHTQSVFEQLGSKQPRAAAPVDLSVIGPASRALAPTTDPKQVETCIRSFHRLSGARPSGLKPVHLTEALEGELWDEIIEHVTALVGLLSRGEAPVSLVPFLARAALTALPKKDDDIRPVAVGDTWCRLTAKCFCATYRMAPADICSFCKLVSASRWRLKLGRQCLANGAGGTAVTHLLVLL